MRKAGPILILLIGVLALIVNFSPGLRVPDSSTAEGSRPIETKLGLDLSGGLRVEYQAIPVDGQSPTSGDMSVIKDIIERRVNQTGVSEPVVTTQGGDRVVVELPGVTDPEVDPQARRPDRPARLRAARSDDGHGRPDPRPHPVPAVVQRRPGRRRRRSGTDQNGRPAVDFVLKDEGAKLFADYTAAHVNDYFAITLDGSVISAPVIKNSIPNGQVQITGGGLAGFNVKDADDLVTVLKFGSLPFPIQELSSEQISATLGSQFLDQSLLAGALGILLVITFMVIYYRLIGLVASFALIYYTIVMFAIFRLIPVTLTLAGIAGFVLSIGMAVDANILIFERMKEELRVGKSLPAGGRGRLQPGLELHPRLERVEPDHRDDPVRPRFVGHPGLRARPDHRRPRLDVQRDRRDPDDPALGRPPGVGTPARSVRAARRRVRRPRRRPTFVPA